MPHPMGSSQHQCWRHLSHSPTESQEASAFPHALWFTNLREFAEQSLPMKESSVSGPSPMLGTGGHSDMPAASRQHQHAPQGSGPITSKPACMKPPLLRGLPALVKPGNETQWAAVFAFWPPETGSLYLLFSVHSLLRFADPSWHEAQFQMPLLRATTLLLTQNLMLTDEKILFPQHWNIKTGPFLQMRSCRWGKCGWNL